MARKPRIEFEGALYHVITRGNRKEAIFLDRKDRQHFLRKLREYKRQYGFILYAYVLMKNHLHLLLQTGQTALSKIMQGLLLSQGQWHNRKYDVVGHLFQGRYKAILCDKDAYLLELIRYIHLNPLRAGYRSQLKYEWSSHHSYVNVSSNDNDLIDTRLVLSLFDSNKRKALEGYEEFLKDGIAEGKRDDFYEMRDQRILGDDNFCEEVMNRMTGSVVNESLTRKDRTLSEIKTKVAELYEVAEAELKGSTRAQRAVIARSVFIRLSRRYTNLMSKEIAEHLNRQPSSLIAMIRQTTEAEFDKVMAKIGW